MIKDEALLNLGNRVEAFQMKNTRNKYFKSDVRSQNQSRDSRSNSSSSDNDSFLASFKSPTTHTPQGASEISNEESDGP